MNFEVTNSCKRRHEFYKSQQDHKLESKSFSVFKKIIKISIKKEFLTEIFDTKKNDFLLVSFERTPFRSFSCSFQGFSERIATLITTQEPTTEEPTTKQVTTSADATTTSPCAREFVETIIQSDQSIRLLDSTYRDWCIFKKYTSRKILSFVFV